jgi:hypothetical protein
MMMKRKKEKGKRDRRAQGNRNNTPANANYKRALHVLCVFRGCKSASMATVPMAIHQL